MSDSKKQKKINKNKWMKERRVYEMLEKLDLEYLTQDIERSVSFLKEWGFGGESEASEAYFNILYNIPKEYTKDATQIISQEVVDTMILLELKHIKYQHTFQKHFEKFLKVNMKAH